MDNIVLTGLLTSRIETRTKNEETYYYGFFKIKEQLEDIPVIFKVRCLPSLEGSDCCRWFKPEISLRSQVELEGNWANSQKDKTIKELRTQLESSKEASQGGRHE